MGRPRYQEGQIELRNGQWWLRVRDAEGTRKRQFLALQSEFPQFRPDSKTDLARLRSALADRIAPILSRYNPSTARAAARFTLTVAEFIEKSYFPRLDWRLHQPAGNEYHIEPSTIKSYKDIFRNHVQQSNIGKMKLIDVTEMEARLFTEALDQSLSHQTHLRIKNFMRGVFSWAQQNAVFKHPDPFARIKAGGRAKPDPAKLDVRRRKIAASNSHAYTLNEVAEMLEKLPEPARTVCAVAAFTGLSRSELRGLKWDDYDKQSGIIQVHRKVRGKYIGAPKTEAREAGVPVIQTLKKILANYQKQYPSVGEGWIFRGDKMKKPLNLDSLSRRVIPQYINGAWFGWHSFRRGLGTRLNELGVDAETIQEILRHSDVSTTQAYYILPDRKKTEAAMKKLEKTLKAKYDIK